MIKKNKQNQLTILSRGRQKIYKLWQKYGMLLVVIFIGLIIGKILLANFLK